ncbi:MAG: hypothetical protein JW958_12625 [Candidatus Eisenbacteria bacterium]|nr:hypothetical protein [Candidatus Eisenbacteria bacterium]
MKKTIALVMLVLLLVPYTVFAGQMPSVRDAQPNSHHSSVLGDQSTGIQENRGTVSWANNLFWYQLLLLYRWATRWAYLGGAI